MYIQCIGYIVFGQYNIVKKGVGAMATTNITMRMDEDLKAQAEELFADLRN